MDMFLLEQRIRVSSSISNFKEKLNKRTGLKEYRFPQDIFKTVIFFGMYHIGDYLRFALHRGDKKVFWCGSDILKVKKVLGGDVLWTDVQSYCENEVEQMELLRMGIPSKVTPMIFDDPDKYQICYKPSNKPHVFMSLHNDRKQEYGLDQIEIIAGSVPEVTFHIYGCLKPFHEIWEDTIRGVGGSVANTGIMHNVEYATRKNIIYHGRVSEEQFNKEIKNYQGCIRLNRFDGFAETLAKSVLMGQYQYSVIPYKYMNTTQTLGQWLKELKNKKEPNYEAEKYWRETLNNNLNKILYE